MRRINLVLVIVALAGCGQAAPDFRSLGGQDNYAMIVAKGADPASFPALAKAKCGTAQQCSVYAWTDPSDAASAMPMTDREADALAFSYSLNRASGLEQALWNCKFYRRANREECLAEG